MRQSEEVIDQAENRQNDGAGVVLARTSGQKVHDWGEHQAAGQSVSDVVGERHYGDGDESGNQLGQVVERDPPDRLQHQHANRDQRRPVGEAKLQSIRRIAFDDLTELVPAFVTITIMAFTYNIANGLTGGLVLSPIMNLLAGRAREQNAGSIVLAVLCLIYYLFGLPHCCRWTSSSAESRRRSCTFTSKVLSSPS